MADIDRDKGQFFESMVKLKEIQCELGKIQNEERSRLLKVKCKYNDFRRELYDKREEIIHSISSFWVVAFLNHPVLADKVSEEDKKVFKYMISLQVEDFNNEHSGYSITFKFSPNPFFEGTKLTKTYFLSEDGTTNVTSAEIRWKDGMNITGGSAQENKGAKRPITEFSFFNWFEPKVLPIDVFDGIATKIRELWANPLNYFCNEADEEDVNGDGSDDDDKDCDDKKKDEKDFSVSCSNDVDNEHDDKENDNEEGFNVGGSDDESKVIPKDEMEEKNVAEPALDHDDDKEIEEKK